MSDDYIIPLRTIADMITARSPAKLSKLNPEDLANLSVTLSESYTCHSNGIPHQNKDAIATVFKNKSFAERSQFPSQDLVKLAEVFASAREHEEKDAASTSH